MTEEHFTTVIGHAIVLISHSHTVDMENTQEVLELSSLQLLQVVRVILGAK